MIRRYTALPSLAVLLAASALLAPAPAWAIVANNTIVAPQVAKQLRINIAWQIALEAADFSPGVIDGVFKRKGLMALGEYVNRNFPGTENFDPKVYQALKVDVDGAIAQYTITDDDAAQVGGP